MMKSGINHYSKIMRLFFNLILATLLKSIFNLQKDELITNKISNTCIEIEFRIFWKQFKNNNEKDDKALLFNEHILIKASLVVQLNN